MKLLLDQNLSYKLVRCLSDLYPGSKHVRQVGLDEADDTTVWNYAKDNSFVIVSKDEDFHQRSFLSGWPPKVVWLRLGNCSTQDIEHALRRGKALWRYAVAALVTRSVGHQLRSIPIMYRGKPNYLFSKADWFSVREHQTNAMLEEINGYDGNRLLNTPVEDLASYFKQKYRIEVPSRHEDKIVADQRETQIDVSHDPMRYIRDRSRPFYVAGTEVEITIPFDGEPDVFNIRPGTYRLSEN